MSIIIFDTETNGLPKKNYNFEDINLLELGYLTCDSDFNIIENYNNLIKTNCEIPEIITKLTGIDKEKIINNGIEIKDILNKFINDIKKCDIIIAHNNKFDLGIIKKELKKENMLLYYNNLIEKKINIDSVSLFKNYIDKKNINNYKLQTIYNYFNDIEYEQTHRALDDCYMLHNSIKNLMIYNKFNIYKYYLEKPLNFGKYKTMNLKQLYRYDYNYFNFIINNKKISHKIRYFL